MKELRPYPAHSPTALHGLFAMSAGDEGRQRNIRWFLNLEESQGLYNKGLEPHPSHATFRLSPNFFLYLESHNLRMAGLS